MSLINFETELITINGWTILHMPEAASLELPSRGAVMVEGTINDHDFRHPLEPDGRKGHWMPIDTSLAKSAAIGSGDKVVVQLSATKDWPDPVLPNDIKVALESDPQAHDLWYSCTPMARWEWIRWIQATANPDTRAKHIITGISKLKGGHRRPCCFNSSSCTVFEVSKNGVLLDLVAK